MKSCLQSLLFWGLLVLAVKFVFFSETSETPQYNDEYNNSYKEYNINNNKFAKLDKYARDAPESVSQKVSDLAKYLVQGAKTEEEKARALFIWIVYNIDYDMEGFLKGAKRPSSYYTPEFVIKDRKTVCSGYAYLYDALAKEMGLKSHYIVGDVKGAYGSAENPDLIEKHAWNSVEIDGKFYFVDCTWSAGHSDENKKFKRSINFEWYNVLPEQFIFSHRADKNKLQELEKPVALEAFKEMPHITPWIFQQELLNEHHLLADFEAGKKTPDLPKLWRAKVPISHLNIPMEKNLKAGERYIFEAESPYVYKVNVINETNGKKEYHTAKLKDGRFVLEVSLKPGIAKYSFNYDKGKYYYSVVEYEVN